MLLPSVVFTFNVVVPVVLIFTLLAVPATTVCAESAKLSYVVVPVDALFNVTYTSDFVQVPSL